MLNTRVMVREAFLKEPKFKNQKYDCDGIFFKGWGFGEVIKRVKMCKSEPMGPLLWD